ncbi:MAG: hypothetical protein IPO78_15495 [Saprospiraceae bacterium]|nr:hypothetical protein [Saprospiraceae bacterium]MBK9722999.1 hypothetical protein [Saprospiraceae bacterium]
MKIVSIYLDNLIIEVHNSILGKEIIKVNGNIVSSKYSIFGAKHRFEHENNVYTITFFLGLSGMQFDLYKNELPIIEASKQGCVQIISVLLVITFCLYLIDRFL